MPISHGHRPYEYNEFIPELESNVLVDAVRLKQNLYDEGSAKIQSYYDELSTLPLVRDADKAYMNQELNKVFSVIRNNVGSSDFSNPQTVKSFIDIAKPLERDPIMKNAVESSTEYHSRLQTLEDIRTKHPEMYSEANEWDYMNDVNKWAADPNPGAKLSQKYYNPYVDNAKKHSDLISKLQPDIDSYVDKMTNSGMYTVEEIKSLKSGKVKELLLQSMTPQELKQLDIDARYETSRLPIESKYNAVVSTYQKIISRNMALSKVRGIENETGTTREEYLDEARAAQEILSQLQNPEGQINREYVDRLYSNAYIDNWAEGLGKTYSYKQKKVKLETNPFALENSKHNHALTRLGEQFKYNMQLKGFEFDSTTNKWKPGPNYQAIQAKKAAASKPLKAPEIFTKDTNDARMEKLKTGEVSDITLEEREVMTQLNPAFKDRLYAAMERKGWTKMDDNGDYNNTIKTMKVSKTPEGLKYTIDLKTKDGVVKKIIAESTLKNEVVDYFNDNSTVTPDAPQVVDTYVPEPETPVTEPPVTEPTEEELEAELQKELNNQ